MSVRAENAEIPAFDAALRERMLTAFTATLSAENAELTAPAAAPGSAMVDKAAFAACFAQINQTVPVYFKEYIPSRPPRLLLAKIIRRVRIAVLGPQITANEAARDALIQVFYLLEQTADAASEAAQKVHALEEKVADLEHRLLSEGHAGEEYKRGIGGNL